MMKKTGIVRVPAWTGKKTMVWSVCPEEEPADEEETECANS
jgi:hypothetical protein